MAEMPPPPPKPQPIMNPTKEQYKQFMIERYAYEKWENDTLLLRRRIEQARDMITKNSWADDAPTNIVVPPASPNAASANNNDQVKLMLCLL